jgi:hypothetical protein
MIDMHGLNITSLIDKLSFKLYRHRFVWLFREAEQRFLLLFLEKEELIPLTIFKKSVCSASAKTIGSPNGLFPILPG